MKRIAPYEPAHHKLQNHHGGAADPLLHRQRVRSSRARDRGAIPSGSSGTEFCVALALSHHEHLVGRASK